MNCNYTNCWSNKFKLTQFDCTPKNMVVSMLPEAHSALMVRIIQLVFRLPGRPRRHCYTCYKDRVYKNYTTNVSHISRPFVHTSNLLLKLMLNAAIDGLDFFYLFRVIDRMLDIAEVQTILSSELIELHRESFVTNFNQPWATWLVYIRSEISFLNILEKKGGVGRTSRLYCLKK